MTSGGPAPTLNKNIGMCFLPLSLAEPENTIEISVRGRGVEAVTIPMPFYKRLSEVIMYPENYRYTKEHEWVHVENGIGTIGITDHAQNELGDIGIRRGPQSRHSCRTGQDFRGG